MSGGGQQPRWRRPGEALPPPPAVPPGAVPGPPAVYAPPQGFAAPGGYGPLPPPRPASRALAITALSIAIPASLLSLVPIVGRVFTLAVLAAIVIAVVSLAMRRPGKGMSIAAIVVSVLVGIIAPAVLFVLRTGFILWGVFDIVRDSS